MRLATLTLFLLAGCTIAPHGSKATHAIMEFSGRPDGKVREEFWTDRSAGGGIEFLSTIGLQNVSLDHTNSILEVGGRFTHLLGKQLAHRRRSHE